MSTLHCHRDSGLCAITRLHSRGAYQVDLILQVKSDTLPACKSNKAPNAHTTMHTAEPEAGIGGVEQDEPEAEH